MRLLALALTLAWLLPAAAAAQTYTPVQAGQTPGSKIFVANCRPHLHTAAEEHPWIDPYGNAHYNEFPSFDAFLAISYKNQAAVPATEVDFGLFASNTLVAVVKDVGTFAPDTPVDHEFVVSREIFPLGIDPHCTVMRIKYQDGTTWSNPSPQ